MGIPPPPPPLSKKKCEGYPFYRSLPCRSLGRCLLAHFFFFFLPPPFFFFNFLAALTATPTAFSLSTASFSCSIFSSCVPADKHDDEKRRRPYPCETRAQVTTMYGYVRSDCVILYQVLICIRSTTYVHTALDENVRAFSGFVIMCQGPYASVQKGVHFNYPDVFCHPTNAFCHKFEKKRKQL